MARYLFQPLAANAPDDLKRVHHAEALLGSDDFTMELLRGALPKDERGGSKAELARALAEHVRRDGAVAETLFRAYVLRPKTWFTVYRAPIKQGFTARSANEFVIDHGDAEDCFGPITHGSALYYVYTRSVPQWYAAPTEGAQLTRRFLRWSCVIQMTTEWVALHWDNFSCRDETEDDVQRPETQFPYWNEVPSVVRMLEKQCNVQLRAPNLLRGVLTGVWDRYERQEGFDWTHEKIRALARGVALSASGKKQEEVELDASGVQALTQTLADVAVRELGAASTEGPRVARALLHTLIHHWNPKSYQFRLHGVGDTKLFRGHIYFGTGAFDVQQAGGLKRSGPDSFPHVKCFSDYGGSAKALEFLLPFLELQ